MIDEEHNVERFITVYSSDTEELVTTHSLGSFDLPAFQRAFGVSDSGDPMFECYPVTLEHVEFLGTYLAQPLSWDFEKRCYFVEATTA